MAWSRHRAHAGGDPEQTAGDPHQETRMKTPAAIHATTSPCTGRRALPSRTQSPARWLAGGCRIAALPALLALAACGQDATPPDRAPQDLNGIARAPDPAAEPAVDPARVPVAPGAEAMLVRGGTGAGYLADAAGMALYYVEPGGAPCDEACQEVWPPVVADVPNPVAAVDLQQAAVGSVPLQQGANHVTYHGHRLYRYAGDRGAQTATGHDVQDKWGHWKLMGVDGSAGTPPAATGSTGAAPGNDRDAGRESPAPGTPTP
jgi:predicted lipoprotein with Yx(FWY)xxD motif